MSEEMLSPGEDATLRRGGGSSARKARVRAQECHAGGGRQPGAFRARAGTPAAGICPCAPGTCIHCLGPLAWGLDRSHGSPRCRGGRGSNSRPGSGLAGHPRGRHPRSGGQGRLRVTLPQREAGGTLPPCFWEAASRDVLPMSVSEPRAGVPQETSPQGRRGEHLGAAPPGAMGTARSEEKWECPRARTAVVPAALPTQLPACSF